mgnify:CR=1 FL=1
MTKRRINKENLDFNVVESVKPDTPNHYHEIGAVGLTDNLTHSHEIGVVESTKSGTLSHTHTIDFVKNTVSEGDFLVWAKATETAVIPTKRDEDGGYDLFCDYPLDTHNVEIKPHETIMIPTNIHVAFTKKYVMILKERGSNGSIGLAQRAGVIDSGYRGAIFVAITNENDIPVVITRSTDKVEKFAGKIYYPMSKAISQAVMVVSPQLNSKEVTMEEFNKIPSERGDGKLGSSGK